jgi:hypothetical protein
MRVGGGSIGSTRYTVDAAGTIVAVGVGWDAFALANQAAHWSGRQALGRTLTEYVQDATSRELYRTLFQRVWRGGALALPFRCDGPALRRRMELRLARQGDGIACEAVLLETSARTPVALLEPNAPRGDDIVRICGWCKRVPIGSHWVEVDEAVTRLRLFDAPRLPRLSHGICPECFATVDRKTS